MSSGNVSGEQTQRGQNAEADTIIEGQRREATAVDHGLTPGTRLGRYVVLEEIGSGGMGLVFSAYDPELNRKVALKLLRPNQSERKRARSRLLQEAQALAKLAHPNVITVYDVGTIGERVFVAMELIEGATIKGWLAEKPRRWDEILDVFIPAGRGLAAAHAAKLVHRDFKPDNVLIGRDGRVRVMDFGLARPVHGEQSDTGDLDAEADHDDDHGERGRDGDGLYEPLLTQTGSIMGTPAYMAPEQHAGKPTDARSDQFSFCTSLYQALYGERPFDGDDSVTLMQQKLAGKIREPSSGSSVPGWVRRVLLRGLAAAPESRFGSMDELLGELGKDPRILRRKILTTAGLGTAMVGTLTAVYMIKNRPPCQGSQERLEQVWNAARRTEVTDGLSAPGAAFGPPTVEYVATTLDAYGAAWVQMHDEACEATHVRGEQSTRLLERRNACLDDRLGELDALTGVLAKADVVVAANAGFAVGELQPLQQCADTETLNAEVEPPQDPATATAVAAVRTDLVQAKVLAAAGLVRESLSVAQAAYARAQTIATPGGETYQPIVAEARYRLGESQAAAEDTEAAETNLSEASWQSASVKHDVIAAAAAEALVAVVGRGLRKPDEGLSWGRHAEAALKRIGLAGRAEAQLRHDVGIVLASTGEYARARESLEQAVELLAREPASTWWIAAVHRALGDVSLAEGRNADAQAEYDRAAETFVGVFGEQHPDHALALAGFARVQAAQGQTDQARTTLGAAMTLVEGALGPKAPRLLPLCRQLAQLELSVKNYPEAIAQLQRAHGITRDTWGDHAKVAQSLFELGHALERAGRLDEARTEYDRALSLWERTRGKDHPDVAFALTSLGQIDLLQGRANEAVERLERALKLRGGRGLDPQLLAQTQFALARALHALDDRPRARELAAKARDAFKSGKPPAPGSAAEVERWLSDVGESVPPRG